MYLCKATILPSNLMPKIFLIFIFALLPLAANADLFCRKYNFAPDESALENHISNVQQDSSGFMWFATWNGLVRFDGYNFHVFQPILNSDGSIFSNRIYNIRIASTGDIWNVSSDNRLYLFNRKTMEFKNLHSLIPEISEKKVKVITPLKSGVTWITFKDFTAIRLDDSRPTKNYRLFDKNSVELSGSTSINSISRTDIGEEWILTDRKAVNLTKGFSINGNFQSVYTLSGYNVLVSADGTLLRTDLSGKHTDKFCYDPEQPLRLNYSLHINHQLIMATDRGIIGFDPVDGNFVFYGDLPAIYLFKDSRHRVWGFGKNAVIGLIRDVRMEKMDIIRPTETETSEAPMKNPQIIFELPTGEIILRPVGGVLSYFDEKSNRIAACLFHENEIYRSNYSPEGIKKFLVDHDSNLWVFHDRGADCINFKKKYFHHIANPSLLETRALAFDNTGRYWLTDRSNGLRITDRNFRNTLYIDRTGRFITTPTRFSNMPVYSIRTPADGNVWIGTKGDGLYLLEPSKGTNLKYEITHFSASATRQAEWIPTDTIYDITVSGGRIWLGSYGNGLSVGIRDKEGRYRFEHVRNQPPGMKIRTVYDNGDGVLIIGTADGLVTADVRNLASPKFYTNRFRTEKWGLKGNDVMEVVSCNGKIYVCIFGNGLSRIDSDNLLSDEIHFSNFMIPSSASAGQIKTAITDDKNIWVISEKSVSRFSTLSNLYTIYKSDNFTGHFGLSEAHPVAGNNLIAVGTTEGVMYFRPDDPGLSESATHHIAITGIRYQNDMEIRPINDTDSVRLTADRRSFALYLSAMKFGADENIRFRYMLSGYDKGWNYTSENHPEITYNNLPPGDYTLTIECSAHDGSWLNDSRKTIRIYAEPRFTETTGFRLIIVILCLFAICSLVYATIYFKRMRNEIQKKYSLLMSIDRMSRKYKSEQPANTNEGPSEEERQRAFIENSVEFLNANLDNPGLVVEDLARNAGMSRTAYFNRMKQITGLSPVDFIKQMRIKRALKLLDEGSMSISDIAYGVGFTDPKYFSRCFKAEMGMTPSQYLESRKGHSAE